MNFRLQYTEHSYLVATLCEEEQRNETDLLDFSNYVLNHKLSDILESKALALEVRKNNSPKLKLWTPKCWKSCGSVLM
ncbi:hypothetical protein PN36_19670 [Candidatus Thiomargarita nelsonii]|uniref:Uncharacterized protein n=1 Tax=Candidatus Thiomargarita nelsonii TaxID=1003181 RepID=A0A4E0QP00_9GAMM|nr:hypothetical protein PN36_19670 [Candidatus Thiomargarita nelsonii]